MSRTLSAIARWCAIFALWPLIFATLGLSWLLGGAQSGVLSIATWAQRTVKRLQNAD